MDQTQDTPASSVFEFEGDEVTNFAAHLPAVKMEAPEAYPRGTYLTLHLVVRVRSVRLDEDRKGELTRNHVLALEECTITDTLTPAQRRLAMEALERAAQEHEVEEVPGPDAAYVDTPEPAAIKNDQPSVAETHPGTGDEDVDPWEDEEDYPPGALRVELVGSF